MSETTYCQLCGITTSKKLHECSHCMLDICPDCIAKCPVCGEKVCKDCVEMGYCPENP